MLFGARCCEDVLALVRLFIVINFHVNYGGCHVIGSFVLFWQFVAPEMYVYEIPKCTDKVKWLVLLFPFHSIPLSSIPLGWGK